MPSASSSAPGASPTIIRSARIPRYPSTPPKTTLSRVRASGQRWQSSALIRTDASPMGTTPQPLTPLGRRRCHHDTHEDTDVLAEGR